MRFVTFAEVVERIRGKTVAVVGSAPSCLDNEPGLVDLHDVVCRVNNYKLGVGPGFRTDVHYSFYGTSIRKTSAELQRDGVKLCMCKCPDAKPIDSDWHEAHGKQLGIDFRYIYRNRAAWWFCDAYVPDTASFLKKFDLLDKHIPSTGFAAILDVLACKPARVYLTGFDFFTSGIHNINERWKRGDPDDPIGHSPKREVAWLERNMRAHPIQIDRALRKMIETRAARRGEVAA